MSDLAILPTRGFGMLLRPMRVAAVMTAVLSGAGCGGGAPSLSITPSTAPPTPTATTASPSPTPTTPTAVATPSPGEFMLTGGMGGRALQFFQQYGIQPVTGAAGLVRQAVEQCLNGTLQGGAPCRESIEHGHGE